MWPFRKNVMRDFRIDISSQGTFYKVLIWKNYNSFDPKIVASKYDLNSYTEAVYEAEKLWVEIEEARSKVFGK